MRSIISIIGASSIFISSAIMADESYIDYGRVLHAKPIYESIKVYSPGRECRTKHRSESHYSRDDHSHRDSASNAIIGAVVGGVLGHQIGKGRTRDVATATGAVVGATIGNNHSRDGYSSHRKQTKRRHRDWERCQTRHSSFKRELVAYRVTYKYKGEVFTTHMDNHPGKRIRLSINITPLD